MLVCFLFKIIYFKVSLRSAMLRSINQVGSMIYRSKDIWDKYLERQ